MGEALGPQRLCRWLRLFGLGGPPGTGLIEEACGVVHPANTRMLAIGQGRVTATPLQAANLAATVATGYWAPARLVAGGAVGDAAPARNTRLPVEPRHWAVVREGVYAVVNDGRLGSAYKHARLDDAGYVLCGKTGSAEKSKDLPTHAWFIGYVQRRRAGARAGDPGPGGPLFALAVLVEYGGSGGAVAGPLAREIARGALATVYAGPAGALADGGPRTGGSPSAPSLGPIRRSGNL
jgi:cell division protein FtsI/penicillin-binding protein 2